MRNTVYLSGPITGNPNYLLDFARAEQRIEADIRDGIYDFTSCINPAKVNANMPKDFRYEDYMEMCFRMLDLSNAIFMLRGWQESKGARKELAYAKLLGLGVYYEELSEGEL